MFVSILEEVLPSDFDDNVILLSFLLLLFLRRNLRFRRSACRGCGCGCCELPLSVDDEYEGCDGRLLSVLVSPSPSPSSLVTSPPSFSFSLSPSSSEFSVSLTLSVSLSVLVLVPVDVDVDVEELLQRNVCRHNGHGACTPSLWVSK